jgi:hypothetical protein
MKFSIACVLTIFCAVHGPAALADDDIPVVVISGAKNAAHWPMRSLQAGLEAFGDRRRLAPAGALRFRLRALPDVKLFEGVALDVVDGSAVTAIPLAGDGGFVLSGGGGDDAKLVATRNNGQFDAGRLPRAEVLSPGVPDHARRLGDLRLECQVEMAVAKETLGFGQTLAINLLGGIDWCAPRKPKGFRVDAGRPLAQVTLVHGERRETRAVPDKRSYFMAPIADDGWPDDTLIMFQYASGQP